MTESVSDKVTYWAKNCPIEGAQFKTIHFWLKLGPSVVGWVSDNYRPTATVSFGTCFPPQLQFKWTNIFSKFRQIQFAILTNTKRYQTGIIPIDQLTNWNFKTATSIPPFCRPSASKLSSQTLSLFALVAQTNCPSLLMFAKMPPLCHTYTTVEHKYIFEI